MKKTLVLVFALISFIQSKAQEKPYYEDIIKFRNYDKVNPPQKDVILFIGSSTFTIWGDEVRKDFDNNKIINRAFGGSTLVDLINYEDEIIFAYHPKKIVIYCGENDIANDYPKVSGKEVAKRFKQLYQDIRLKFPIIPIVYLAIKPSPSRWEMRNKMIDANRKIEKYLKKQSNNHIVKIWNKLLDEDGKPKASLYLEDELHLNPQGYKILTIELYNYVN
ncbi:MAG TPA: GDSL-type esterase/lipase family protein [Flavobacterium sp.]|uniref:GDSL-type esterase/lipase family protein n=1 Tax=Flavobacterium sp. TaxID=239 RepID=UPI002F40537D